jgi:UrcA family protein
MITTHTLHFFPARRVIRSLMKPAISPAAVVLVLLAGGAAGAANANAPSTAAGPVLTEKRFAVKVDDLDLTTDSGIKAANERILGAARQACDYTTNAGDYVVGRTQVFRACLDRTVAAASGRLEQLRLAALQHGGAPISSASSIASR